MKMYVMPAVGAGLLSVFYALTSVMPADVYSKWGKIPGHYVSPPQPGVFFEILKGGDLSQITALCRYGNAPPIEPPSQEAIVSAGKTAVFTNSIGHSWPLVSHAYGMAGKLDLPVRASQTVRYTEQSLPINFHGEIDAQCLAKLQRAFQDHESTICVVQNVLFSIDGNVYVQFNPWAILPPRPTVVEASAWRVAEKECPLRVYSWFLWPIKGPLIN